MIRSPTIEEAIAESQIYQTGRYLTRQQEEARKRLLAEFMEANPEAYYQSQIQNLPEMQRQYYGPRYGTIYNQFLGAQAQQAQQAGALPSLKFSEWLPGYDFTREYESANPQIAYQRTLAGLNQPMSRFFQNRYSDIYGKYLGSGEGTSFGNWLPNMDFEQEYYSYAPQQRGSYPNRFAPRARWLNY